MKETDAAYIAGLFDGEGHVIYKQYPKQRKGQKKAYPTWKITLEMNMTEESIIRWVHEALGVGTVCKKPFPLQLSQIFFLRLFTFSFAIRFLFLRNSTSRLSIVFQFFL